MIGNVLVLSSMYALGVTGTYLGDYFGILMDEPVTGFPFNVTGAPMYWGSVCSFLGTALYKGRVAGVLLSVEVFFMYLVALQYEEYVDPEITMRWEHANVLQSVHSSYLREARQRASGERWCKQEEALSWSLGSMLLQQVSR